MQTPESLSDAITASSYYHPWNIRDEGGERYNWKYRSALENVDKSLIPRHSGPWSWREPDSRDTNEVEWGDREQVEYDDGEQGMVKTEWGNRA